jgi:hypothetical protein
MGEDNDNDTEEMEECGSQSDTEEEVDEEEEDVEEEGMFQMEEVCNVKSFPAEKVQKPKAASRSSSSTSHSQAGGSIPTGTSATPMSPDPTSKNLFPTSGGTRRDIPIHPSSAERHLPTGTNSYTEFRPILSSSGNFYFFLLSIQ